MELTLSQRQAVTKKKALAHRSASKAGKSRILDELVELTGWNRDYARSALRSALAPRLVRARPPRPVVYGPRVVAALEVCWAVLRGPSGKRLAPMLPVLVPMLRRDGELELSEEEAALLALRKAVHFRMLSAALGSSSANGGKILRPNGSRW